jgi:hypothetical protein
LHKLARIVLYLGPLAFIPAIPENTGAEAFARTQSDPPFLITQLVIMALFIVLGIFAVSKIDPSTPKYWFPANPMARVPHPSHLFAKGG